MRESLLVVLSALGTVAALVPFPARAAITPARVLVVYATNAPDRDGDGVGDSLELARYYAAKRGVPAGNLLGVTPSVATIYGIADYAKFRTEIILPIQTKVAQLGAENIDVILLAGALPQKVTNASGQVMSLDNVLMGLNFWNASTPDFAPLYNPYGANTVGKTPSIGPDAPRFSHSVKFLSTTMYLVARLGSDDALRGMEELDQDLYAERYLSTAAGFYSGTGYIDSRYGIPVGMPNAGKPYTDAWLAANVAAIDPGFFTYASADVWIAYGEHFITAAGFPLRWEQNGASIGDASSTITNATRALWYGGWYNFIKYNDVWDWLPGSVACDLNSAPTFGKQALAHGASNAAYVVAEPYLTGHQRPDILLYYIFRGYTFAEASALSTPNIGWMNLNEGDPLYAPMAPRTPVQDTTAPALAAGPAFSLKPGSTADWLVKLQIDDSAAPELASVRIDYGLTSTYAAVATSGRGYWKHPSVVLPGLTPNVLYHYSVTLTDPSGNVSHTPDATFATGKLAAPVPCTAQVDLASATCQASVQ